MATNGHSGPLAGVRVLEFSGDHRRPFGGTLLSDMGADIIKVEPPAGDPWRGFQPLGLREGRGYISLNRGKRGIALDLNAPEGREIVQALARRWTSSSSTTGRMCPRSSASTIRRSRR